MKGQIRRRKRLRFTVAIWDLLPIETQIALVKAGLVDPHNVDIREDRFGVRLFLLGESTEELERLMKQRPRGAYAAFISGGAARRASDEDED